MKIYIREIVVFRSFAEVYTRKILQIFRVCQQREPTLKFELAEKILRNGLSRNFIPAKYFWSTIRES